MLLPARAMPFMLVFCHAGATYVMLRCHTAADAIRYVAAAPCRYAAVCFTLLAAMILMPSRIRMLPPSATAMRYASMSPLRHCFFAIRVDVDAAVATLMLIARWRMLCYDDAFDAAILPALCLRIVSLCYGAMPLSGLLLRYAMLAADITLTALLR